jgi:hypothetical protein
MCGAGACCYHSRDTGVASRSHSREACPREGGDKLRGNDWLLERDPISNDTNTYGRVARIWRSLPCVPTKV